MKQAEDDPRNITKSPNESAIQMEVVADIYQHQQQSQRNIQSTQIRPYSSAERQRRYREKKKADTLNACTTFSQFSDVQPQQEQTQHDVQINKRQPQSNAERQRKYRKLLREQKLKQQVKNINAITVLSNTSHTSSIHQLQNYNFSVDQTQHTSSIDQLQNVDQAEHARKRHLNKLRQSRFRARQRFESPSQEVKDRKNKRQQRYREQNREKLKQRDAERRKCKQNLQIIAELSTSSNKNTIELNNEKARGAKCQSLSGLEGIQTLSVQENEQAEARSALQKKRILQQKSREQNREKLKKREVERRQSQHNSEIITESYNSAAINCVEIISEAIKHDEISTNSLSVVGLDKTQNLFIEITERVSQPAKKISLSAEIDDIRTTKDLPGICSLCGDSNDHVELLLTHLRDGHQLKQGLFVCPFCDYTSMKYEVVMKHTTKVHKLVSEQHKCEQCDYKTFRGDLFNRHLNQHLKEKIYSCDHCNYKTINLVNFKRHLSSKHTKETEYTCQFCDFKSTNQGMVKKHETAKHTSDKYFSCDKCSYKTTLPHTLKRHQERYCKNRTVKDSKSFTYVCIHCNFKTEDLSALEDHTLLKHPKKEILFCNLCEFSTTESAELSEHARTHLKNEPIDSEN